MSGFTLRVQTTLTPPAAWHVVTDWTAHSRLVPLTRVWAEPGRVTARTALGPFRLDDVMRIDVSEAPTQGRPGRLELVKVGQVHGVASIEVSARPGGGSLVRWQETVRVGPGWFRAASSPVQDRIAEVAFGRLLRRLLRAGERASEAGGVAR